MRLNVGAGGVIHDEDAAVGGGFDGMRGVGRDDSGDSRARDLHDAGDGEFKFAFEDLVDLFLRMEMLVDGSAASEIVMGESHILRMEIAVVPAGKAFDDRERVEVDEGHGNSRHPSTVLRVNGGQGSEANRNTAEG